MSERIAIVGGSGALGQALAGRWHGAGLEVVLGSRDPERARESLSDKTSGVSVATNLDAAREADVVVLTVPFPSHGATLREIAPVISGKLLVDTTVPLKPPKVAVVQLPDEGSAAMIAKSLVDESVEVASAFHTVAAAKLASDQPIDSDVLVFGDKLKARERVISLVQAAGLRGVHGGALANSAAAEAMTSVLISINKRYKSDGSALRITGIGN